MKKYLLVLTVLVSFTAMFYRAKAQSKEPYSFDKQISLPGESDGDYLFTDQDNRMLYVSHRFSVHVLDLNTEKQIGIFENLQGVHGITIAPNAGKGFITEGKGNSVQVFDIKTLKIIKSIPVSGKNPDGVLFDAYSNQVFTWNGNSGNTSVIDVNSLTEKITIELGGRPEFGVSDGKGKVYDNNKSLNIIKVIDCKTLKVVDSITPLPCETPVALCYDSKNKRLFTGCRGNKGMSVININNNKVITTLPICPEVDAIRFDEETGLIFCAGDGCTTIIKQESADKYSVVQTLVTGPLAKTMEIDKKTHKIYISIGDYALQENGKQKPIPNTMRLLVYKLNK